MVVDNCNSEECTLLLTGYLRACSLSVNQLVTSSAIGLPLVTLLDVFLIFLQTRFIFPVRVITS
jgi:hypothetical protein